MPDLSAVAAATAIVTLVIPPYEVVKKNDDLTNKIQLTYEKRLVDINDDDVSITVNDTSKDALKSYPIIMISAQ